MPPSEFIDGLGGKGERRKTFRRPPRLAVREAVELASDDVHFTGTIVDISQGGVKIYLSTGFEPIHVGDILKVRATLPRLGRLPALAKVRWCDTALNHRGQRIDALGLEFEWDVEAHIQFKNKLTALLPRILVYGEDSDIVSALESSFEVTQVSSSDESLTQLDIQEFAVFVLGSKLNPLDARNLLDRSITDFPNNNTVNIAFCVGSESAMFQDFIDYDQVFYLSQDRGAVSQTLAIVSGAHARYRSTIDLGRRRDVLDDGESSRELLEFIRQITLQSDPVSASRLVARAAGRLLNAKHSDCLIHDSDENILWLTDPDTRERREESAAAGLIGFVVRTGEPVVLPRAADDPRFDPDSDDPGGCETDHIVAAPIQAGGVVYAVLVLTRRPEAPSFDAQDLEVLGMLSDHTAPLFSQLSLEQRIAGDVSRRAQVDIFRNEAVSHHHQGLGTDGHLLEPVPSWLLRSHWLLLGAAVIAGIFVSMSRVSDYAEGPTVIRIKNKTQVTSSRTGIVSWIAVSPGQRVQAGDEILRLQDDVQANELECIKQELQLQLISSRSKTFGEVGQALASLCSQEELAKSPQRKILAPADGLIADVGVHPGQGLQPGDLVVTLISGEPQFEIVGLLAGQYGSQLFANQPARLMLQGHMSSQPISLGRVSEVVGPSEARHYLGKEASDSLRIPGSVVLVHADIPSFVTNGRSYAYHDGMAGLVEIRLRSEPAIMALIPGLSLFLD